MRLRYPSEIDYIYAILFLIQQVKRFAKYPKKTIIYIIDNIKCRYLLFQIFWHMCMRRGLCKTKTSGGRFGNECLFIFRPSALGAYVFFNLTKESAMQKLIILLCFVFVGCATTQSNEEPQPKSPNKLVSAQKKKRNIHWGRFMRPMTLTINGR